MKQHFSSQELLALLGDTVVVEGTLPEHLSGYGPLDDCESSHVSFLANQRFVPQAQSSRAGVLLVSRDIAFESDQACVIRVDDASQAFTAVVTQFGPEESRYQPGVHQTAVIDPSAQVPASCHIGPFVVIGANTRLGEGCVLTSHVHVGSDCEIGAQCLLYSHVVVRERVCLGRNVVLHPHAVIGADGYGFTQSDDAFSKIPQTGGVVLEDDVEIGAGSCVDRARFANTVIGQGTKIDNLCQIGHNVRIGRHCYMAAHCAIAGSVVFEDGVMMGGLSGVDNHVTLGQKTRVAAATVVTKDTAPGEVVMGFPARPRQEFLRAHARLHKTQNKGRRDGS